MKTDPIKHIINITLLCLLMVLQSYAIAEITVTYYIPDASGSPVAATDEQGNVKWRKHYKPFGEEIEQGLASHNNHVGYTGHVHDRSTGLTYMGARYYDPIVGRFMGMDSAAVRAEDPRTFNRYVYANNNPYKFIDPDGRDATGIPSIAWPQVSREAPHAWNAIKDGTKNGLIAIGIIATSGLGATSQTAVAAVRAKQVHQVLGKVTQTKTTTAVTETQQGIRVISSSESRLRPAQRKLLGPNEVEGVGAGHAEVTGVKAAKKMGLTPTGTAASRGICSGCQNFLKGENVKPLSPLKK